MPHMRIEYSHGLTVPEVESLCRAVHAAMVGAGIFPLAGIRVRAFRADVAIVADGDAKNDFAALTLSVGAGRRTEALRAGGDLVFRAAQGALAHRLCEPHFALSLEIRVIDPELSWKDTPIHARLSGQKKD
ncbi:5-carboxymethyl-2-hydroxymuconate isomerase [Salipiger sp. HF18]|uniref:5-carboxymethyl-2-hydroxymuconate Delta-isomerase n=1 Tax=Salipiger sp. HF18 TaxID=2721557 RepID=UPI00142E6A48|nr:5-carboxymethyl-2-hydroxymuconate Delta-isomerase [Salipiger sp. HF18]NIY95605.1 5-carboxymethyl-2-hydroxymuconate isomerase [Salipiger sp. HF18]